MALWIRAEVLRLTNIRAGQLRVVGNPGPGGLDRQGDVGRPQQGHHRVHRRPAGRRGDAQARRLPDGAPRARDEWGSPQQAFLRTRANSIEGGTTEIAKNILGERVLGLPGDVRGDKDVPWSQVPRS